MVELAGLLAMLAAIYAARQGDRVGSPHQIAIGTTVVSCIFLFFVLADAGPDAATVVILSYTVLNLGIAALLPWGIWSQLAFVSVLLVLVQLRMAMLTGSLFLDRAVYVATFAGLGLSLFLAWSLERSRQTLARQRYELADQRDSAEQQRRLAEQQRIEAEALAHDLDAYAHTVAHDLKNPINVISGYADVLETELGDRLDDQRRRILGQITKGCEKMAQITTELLLLANVRKLADVPQESLDMSTIVDETRQRVSKLIEASGAEVIVPEEWPRAIGHAPWVEEVWANYISNAIKYGGSPPRLELGADPVGDRSTHFWVRDNGPGFEEEQAAGLFQEFSRATSVPSGGHGLGLSIVKRIVERLGGEVSVKSAMGKASPGFSDPLVRWTTRPRPWHEAYVSITCATWLPPDEAGSGCGAGKG